MKGLCVAAMLLLSGCSVCNEFCDEGLQLTLSYDDPMTGELRIAIDDEEQRCDVSGLEGAPQDHPDRISCSGDELVSFAPNSHDGSLGLDIVDRRGRGATPDSVFVEFESPAGTLLIDELLEPEYDDHKVGCGITARRCVSAEVELDLP